MSSLAHFYTAFTLVDITATGVVRGDNEIKRNQQRNWETITQLLQLRTQISLTEVPVLTDIGHWQFHFEVENPGAYQTNDRQLGALLEDCENVPILVGLTEQPACAPQVRTHGPEQNIWFKLIE